MPWLRVDKFTDVNLELFTIVQHSIPASDWKIKSGRVVCVELTPEQATLPLDSLIIMYQTGIFRLSTRARKLLETIVGIIKTSNFAGEIAAAKAQYKKITGNEYKEHP